MTPERWQQIKTVYEQAVALGLSERIAYVRNACASDQDLLREVESLLTYGDRAGTTFLRVPAANLLRPAAPPEQMPSCVGRRVGVYEIISELGRGGMGEVYRAVRADGQFTKQVAVKLVRGGFGSRFVLERFRNERQILATLEHPHIARLLDGGTTEDGNPYLVMELVEGERIDDYCRSHALSVTDRLRLFREVCGAVQYAHQRLVIHRDIKPSNILVTEAGEPKLLDFGIAKILDPSGSEETTQARPMTPEYASPEQIRGDTITTATDVYSLGVVLYWLLTGRSPYGVTSDTPLQLSRAIAETEPQRPSTAVLKPAKSYKDDASESVVNKGGNLPDVPPVKLHRQLRGDLDDIVMMALRKEPDRRYASVQQFAEDISRHLAGLPVSASKGSWNYRAGKFIRRHRVGVLTASVAALALAIGVGQIAREAHIARIERQRAENRFNDVHHIANSLIFDTDNAIANLPGSTAARKLVVDNAVHYLDTLAREAKGNLTLQRELANAYRKLGDVQGNPSQPNLGDTAAALESYRKSLAMSEALVHANPDSRDDQVALAFGYANFGSVLQAINGDLQDALSYETKALAMLEPLAQSNPADPNFLNALRGVHTSIGDIQAGNGAAPGLCDMDAALDNHRQALAIAERQLRDQPGDPRFRHNVASSYLKIGDDLVKLGDRTGALENYRKALAVFNTPPGSGDIRVIQLTYERMGNAEVMDGNVRDALKSYRAMAEMSQKALDEDPQNVLARSDLATAYSLHGNAVAASGDRRQGLALLNTGIDMLEKETARNPKFLFARRLLAMVSLLRGQVLLKSRNLVGALSDFRKSAAIDEASIAANLRDSNARSELAAANSKIADVLVARGDSDAAIDSYQKALVELEPFAHSAHPFVQAQYAVADTYSGLGVAYTSKASHGALPASRQVELLTQARSWFERSLAEWQRVPNPGKFSPSGFETAGPLAVTTKLSRCNDQLKNLENTTSAPIR